MSLNVENNNSDLRAVKTDLNNSNCLGIIVSYVGVPDPTMLDEPLAEIFCRQITTQATRQNHDGDYTLFSRFVVDLDVPAHLPCLAKIETAFSILFGIEKDAGSKISEWRQAWGIAEPKEEDVLLKRMGAIAGFAMTTVEDDALDQLTSWLRDFGENAGKLPRELFYDAAGKHTDIATRRAWINGHTDELSSLSIEPGAMTIPTLPPEIGAFKQLTALRLEKICWFPPAIGELCNLTELDCGANRLRFTGSNLRTLPNSITKLQNLTWLNLSNNYWLESLPALDQLPKLSNLDLNLTCLSVLRSPCLDPLRARGCKVYVRAVLKVPGSLAQIPPAIRLT